jgi:cytosine permease
LNATAQTQPAAAGLHATEDYASERVPLTERRSTLDIALVRMGFTISSTDVLFGFALGLYFGLWQAILITLIYSAAVSGLSILMGIIGQREGTSAALSTRLVFGRQGSRVPSLVLAALYTGFYGYVIAITAVVLPGDSTLVTALYCVVLSIVYTAITLLGFQRGLAWISRVGIPLSVIVMLAAAFVAVDQAGGIGTLADKTPIDAGGFTVIAMVALGISKWTAAATATPDLTRFARDKKAVVTTTIAEFIVGNIGFNLLGIVIGLAVGKADLGAAFDALDIAWLTSAAMLIMSFTLGCNCVYGGGLAACNTFGLRRVPACLIIGVLGAALGIYGVSAGLVASFLTYIGYIGYALSLIPGILLADYFLLRRMRYPRDLSALPVANQRALIAFAIGLAINLWLGFGMDDKLIHVLPVVGFVTYLAISWRQLLSGPAHSASFSGASSSARISERNAAASAP